MTIEGWRYLHNYLAPLAPFLSRDDVTDLYVNRPQEVWIETLGGTIERFDVPELDPPRLERLVRQVAAYSHQGVNREAPLLSATLPDGSRVQAVLPPATRGAIALAIRRHLAADLTLADYDADDAFATARAALDKGALHDRLSGLRDRGDLSGLLREAVTARLNVLVSGGTSTGKTTFLNALIREVPSSERLVTIEDTPELRVKHENAVGLLAVRGMLGEAQVSADHLVSASLRMRPDRIILGELRGPEAYAFLRAINTGHPGSMTTVHANSTDSAVEQIALLVLQSGTTLSRADVVDYIRASIGVFVQLARVSGRRHVTEVVVR